VHKWLGWGEGSRCLVEDGCVWCAEVCVGGMGSRGWVQGVEAVEGLGGIADGWVTDNYVARES
jgi:hypothetical protein